MSRVWFKVTKDGQETQISDEDLEMLLATKYAMPIEEARTFIDLLPIGHRMGTADADYELRETKD